MDNIIPCKDCICFAICKSRYIKKIAGCVYIDIGCMYTKCSLYSCWYMGEVIGEKLTYETFGVKYFGKQ